MTQVDLALLLAVDVSASVDRDEFELMIGGLAAAIRDPRLLNAIAAQRRARIAIAIMFWSEAQDMAVPWQLLGDAADAERLAAALASAPRLPRAGATALGEALVEALRQMATCPFQATRSVVDVSGDGASNRGRAPGPVRDLAVAAGLTVNALAVINEEPDLLAYLSAEVIGGRGAFAIPCHDYADFQTAMLLKLLREVDSAGAASS